MAAPLAGSAAWPGPEAPARMPATRAPPKTIRRVRPPGRPGVDRFTWRAGRASTAAGAPRRHQAVEADVHDQVAVVVHVVLDGDEDGRPALHLLVVPPLDQPHRLLLGEAVPHLGAVLVARPQLLQDLVAGLEGLEAGVARKALAGDPAEERVVLADQVDEDLPERSHRGRRLEVVLVLGNDLGDS